MVCEPHHIVLDIHCDQDDEPDYHDSRRSAARRPFEDDFEMEARAEKRIMNAKKVCHLYLV